VFHDQFAFRPTDKEECTAALIYLLHYLTHSLKNHKSVHLIAVDFSKAVRHYTLATKIANFSISDNVYNWIINFLTDKRLLHVK